MTCDDYNAPPEKRAASIYCDNLEAGGSKETNNLIIGIATKAFLAGVQWANERQLGASIDRSKAINDLHTHTNPIEGQVGGIDRRDIAETTEVVGIWTCPGGLIKKE